MKTIKTIARVAICVVFATAAMLPLAGCSAGGVKVDIEGVSFSEQDGKTVVENAGLGVKLDVDMKTGVYHVTRNGRVWIGDGLVAMRIKDSMLLNAKPDGTASADMKLTGSSNGGGLGPLGAYRSLTLQWEAEGLTFETQFRIYSGTPQVEFVHVFPDGYRAVDTVKRELTKLNFPVFAAGDTGDGLNLFYYSYPTWPGPRFGKGVRKALGVRDEGEVIMPLAIFDAEGAGGIMSTLNDYLIRMVRVIDIEGFGPGVAAGLNGELERLDPGHESKTLLHFNDGGVANIFYSWGAQMLLENSKKPVDKDETLFLKYVGYWTDNGAYYYYRTEPDKNYETTLLEFFDYIRKEDIPLKYLQLDSWWYPKSEKDGGVMVWEPIGEMFPEGLVEFQKKLGLPMTFHNRYYAIDTPYQERMEFLKGSEGVHPVGREIFDEFAANVKSWGGIMYEQDWLNKQTNRVEALRRDPYLADNWMTDMSRAMADKGLEIQYCMPTIDFYFESSKFQNVTNIRTSNDYAIRLAGRSNQLWWEQVYTSMIADALGILPFKDVIITNPPPKESSNPIVNQYNVATGGRREEDIDLYEPFYHQSALLSILSAGPVGVGDRIDAVNKRIVMLIADEEGNLVKPDRPLIPVDRMFYEDPMSQSEILTGYTFSKIGGATWYYVLGMNVNEAMTKLGFSLTPADIGLEGRYVVFDFINNRAKNLDEDFSLELKLKALDFLYFVLAPLTGQGRALIGDAGKYVTASADRIKS
ncbi:MAG: hypothetical protein ABIG68_13845, partial [Acidobacteriota bacterium]